MAKCNGAPIFNIMISVKSFTIFESYYVFQIFRQGTGWVTKVWNLKSNFKSSKSKKDVLYIMSWKIIEEENQKLKTEIEISLNENWREKSKIKNQNWHFKSPKHKKDIVPPWMIIEEKNPAKFWGFFWRNSRKSKICRWKSFPGFLPKVSQQ